MGSIALLFKVFIWLIIIQSIQSNDNHQSNPLIDSTGSLIVAEKLQMNSVVESGSRPFRPSVTSIIETLDKINSSNCTTQFTRLDDLADYLKYAEIVFESLVILFTIQVYLLTKCVAIDQIKGIKSFHDTQTTNSRRANPLSTGATTTTTRKASRSKVGQHPTGTRSKFFDAISHYFA